VPERLRVVNWKKRTGPAKTQIVEKEIENERLGFWKGLNRVYILNADERLKELEAIVSDKDVLNALAFLRLKYISNNKIDDAERIREIFERTVKIVRQL